MHGATIKIINAQQARLNNIYKITKLKLLKTNATIWFNKICRDKQLKPKYISFKSPLASLHEKQRTQIQDTLPQQYYNEKFHILTRDYS